YLAGRTEAETATALGVEIGSVKQRLHKGRGALRRNLASWNGGYRVLKNEQPDLVEMRVVDVRLRRAEGDRPSQHIIILEETATRRRLPIWIGRSEAEYLALELEKTKPPRPPTFAFAA